MLYRSLMTFTVWAPTLDELCVCLCALGMWICVYLSICLDMDAVDVWLHTSGEYDGRRRRSWVPYDWQVLIYRSSWPICVWRMACLTVRRWCISVVKSVINRWFSFHEDWILKELLSILGYYQSNIKEMYLFFCRIYFNFKNMKHF